MGASVKQNLQLVGEESPLEKAAAAQDKFVATIGDVVTRKLVEILDKGADEVARVSAAKALLDWIRPTKTGIAVNINNSPQYTSHLNLPAPQPPQEVVDAEVIPTPRSKVLPEPAPAMAEARLTQKTNFDALRELQAEHAPAIAEGELHRERSATPRTPDRPEPPSSVKMFR